MNVQGFNTLLAAGLAMKIAADGASFKFGSSDVPPEDTQTGLQGTQLYSVAATLTTTGSESKLEATAVPSLNQTWKEVGIFVGAVMISRSVLVGAEVISGQQYPIAWLETFTLSGI